jgi:hypothetical protein
MTTSTGRKRERERKRERKRFFDVLSDLCVTTLELIQDTGGNEPTMPPRMVASRMAVEILSCAVLNGLLRLHNLKNLPPCPARLPEIVSVLLRFLPSFSRMPTLTLQQGRHEG